MMGARKQCWCYIYLCKQTNPGDAVEIFHHVTYNTIDCGLQEKPVIRYNECLPCQTMLKYKHLSNFIPMDLYIIGTTLYTATEKNQSNFSDLNPTDGKQDNWLYQI